MPKLQFRKVPVKYDLWVAWYNAYTPGNNTHLTLDTNEGTLQVKVHTLRYESGTPECLLFGGHVEDGQYKGRNYKAFTNGTTDYVHID